MGMLYVPIRRSMYLTLGAINKMAPHLREEIFILCYHSIDNDGWAFSIKLEEFKKHIGYLTENGYKFITLSDLFKFINGGKEIPKHSVILSFDDGYKNILETREFLKKLGIRPALAVLSDTENANRKELDNDKEFLTKTEILNLVKDGWEIGSHTATHSDMNTLSDKQIIEEVEGSKKKLESELKIPINYLAFSKGRYSPKILKAVKKAGYKMALTMNDGEIYKGMNKFLIPRIGVDGTHSFAEFKTLFLPLNIKVRSFLKELGYGK